MEVDIKKTENQNTNDDEFEEEEILVYVRFEDLNDDYSDEELNNLKVVGLDTDEPIIQIGNKAFGGTWKEAVGTPVFFEEAPPEPKRCYFSKEVKKPLKYLTKTSKCLNLKRIFISPKENSETDKNEMDVDESEQGE